jgi:uncharacterized protein (TIGR04255 family)
MSLPDYPQVRFSRSPLKQVVAQIRFPALLRLGEISSVASFQDRIRGSYPEFQREQRAAFQVPVEQPSSLLTEAYYRFSDREGRWSVRLTEASLTLETKSYLTADDLAARFQQVLGAAQETLGLDERQRLGLRYLNELRVPEVTTLAHWSQWLRPEFVGFSAPLFDEPVEHTAQEVRVRRADGVFTVRHGLLKGSSLLPGKTGEPLAAEPFYLLDLDYWDARRVPLDVKATLEQLQSFSRFIYRFFRWTLSDSLYSALEPVP